MGKTTIELDRDQAAFIADVVRDGHFADPESAVRAAIDGLQFQMTDAGNLRIAIGAGLQALNDGDHVEIDDAGLDALLDSLTTPQR